MAGSRKRKTAAIRSLNPKRIKGAEGSSVKGGKKLPGKRNPPTVVLHPKYPST
jgi:hypothetical protein